LGSRAWCGVCRSGNGGNMAERVVIGNCELWHGDCREVLPLLPPVDLVLTY